ncbi:uncharacterized protein TNCV_1171591 [Trichonephila clavipes]|nr:uncharacterized protein TNCV_1171591 [Trichonephila clavipes]
MKYVSKLNNGQTEVERLSLLLAVRHDGWCFIGLLCKTASTSATFVFTMDALTECFLSAPDLVSRNHCTKRVIVDAFDAVSPGYFCWNAFITGNEIL